MNYKFISGSVIFVLFLSVFYSCGEKPDVIYTNGKIYTMNESNSIVEAVAIKEGKILDAGSNSDISGKYKADEVIDLQGATVLPGFIDSEGSIIEFSKNLNFVNLSYVKSIDEIKDILIEKTKTTKKYGEYELLIRKAGEEAYDTILFKATADNSYKLMSRKLNNVAIDFIMSDLHHLHNFEIQIRGVQPATVPLETVSSNWSPVVTFHTAIPLNSLSGFLYNKDLSTGIRKYFPQNTNVSLRRQMWIDDIY